VTKARVDGDSFTISAFHAPCRRKSCEECWRRYVEHLVAVSVPVLNKRASCAYFLIFLRTTRTSLNNFRMRAKRVGGDWLAVPLLTGDTAVLSNVETAGSQPVEDTERVVRMMLRQHDRSRRVSSSGIRLTSRQSQTTDDVWALAMTLEEFADLLEGMGLTVEWSGVGWFSVRGLDADTIARLKAMAS
jgi:hypothetical protein